MVFNSVAPEWRDDQFNSSAPAIFKYGSEIDYLSISYQPEVVIGSMTQEATDGRSALIQVMTWCR